MVCWSVGFGASGVAGASSSVTVASATMTDDPADGPTRSDGAPHC